MNLKLTKENDKVKLSDEKGNVLGWLPLDADERRMQTFSDTIIRFMKGNVVEEETPQPGKQSGKKPGFTYSNGMIEVEEEALLSAVRGVSSFLSGLSRK